MTLNRARLTVLGGLFALSLTAGCGTDTAGTEQATAGGVPGSLDQAPYSAINTWAYGGRSPGAVQREVQNLVAACMHDRGWDYQPAAIDAPDEPVTVGELRNYRSEHGYGLADAASAPVPGKDDDRTPAEALAHSRDLGHPATSARSDGTCFGAAVRALGVPAYGPEEVRFAIGDASTSVIEDREFEEAIARWSRCVAEEAGIKATTLEDPRHHVETAGLSGEELRNEERRVAVADFRCQETTVIPVRVPLEAAAVAQLQTKYSEPG